MERGLLPVGEDASNQHGAPARARAVNRHRGHEIGGSVLLKYGSARRGATILGQELRCPQLQLRQRRTIHPTFEKPVERTLALVTQSWRKLFGEHGEQFARADGLPLITLPYLSQCAREWFIFPAPASAGTFRLQCRAILHHGAQHVKQPCAAAITDGVIAPGRTRRLQAAS